MTPRHRSIRQRLLWISATITLLSLLLAGALLALHGMRTLHDQLARDLDVLADVVGENCTTALLFDAPESAQKHLSSLRREYLQRRVSEPLLRLAAAAREISERGDYRLRVTPPRGEDEITVLYRGFNAMLSQIERRAAAENKNRAKDIFLANLSHELRTPLNAMIGFAQILEDDATLGEPQRGQAQDIRRSGLRLVELIDDLLDLARIEVDQIQILPEPWRPRELIEELAKTFRHTAASKGVQLRIDTAPTLPQCCLCDPRRVRQVLVNLLGNAVKFTAVGEVTLRVEHRDDCLIVEVADTGPGIAGDSLARIFEPFEQAGDRNQRAQGVGLGLAITGRLVDRMGGTIQVESALGLGSRFRVQIPAPRLGEVLDPMEDPAVAPPILGHRPMREGGPFHLLVVDDEADNRAVLRGLLTQLGFRVSEAKSGEDCLSLLQSGAAPPPELILMDLRMPDRDGLETTRALRRIPGLATLPIVIVSAAASPRDQAEALAAGCDAFVAKPIARQTLIGVIADLLPLTWRQAEAAPPPAAEAPLAGLPPDQARALVWLIDNGDIAAIEALAEGWLQAGCCPDLALRIARLAAQCQIATLQRLAGRDPPGR